MAARKPAKPITLAKTANPPEAPAKAAPAPKKAEAPAPAKPVPAKPVAAKPVAAAPVAAKHVAAKPAPAKAEAPVAAKPAPKPVEIKVAAPAPKPVETKPVETKPAETKPVAAKPVAAKPAEAPVKAIPVAALDMSGVQDNLRKTASKTLEQGRAAFERMKEASDEATHTIEASLAATSKGAAELASRALEVTKINANATFDHLKALAGAKTLAEAMSMHGQFIRTQSEAAVAQAKEFAELAKKAATDAAAPLQAQIKKAQAK